MKKFVIGLGNGLIDFAAIISLILIIVSGGFALFSDASVFGAVLVWAVGLIVYVMLFYTLYLFISINDNLTEINKKLAPKQEEKITIENTGLNGKTYKEN